jgi:hypothetical protein
MTNQQDEVWLTCCSLHYWLLNIDGLSGEWNGGISVSSWTGPLGDMDFDGLNEDVPNAIAHLTCNLDPKNYDSSRLGRGCIVLSNDMIPHEHVSDLLINSVSLMNLLAFRRKLVKHHAIQFHKNALVWPTPNS